MKQYFIILFSLYQFGLFAQGFSRVEYFIDTDPGFGSATSAPLPIGDSTQFVTNLSAVSTGIHTMYIRVKDSKGYWSQTVSRPFIKHAIPRNAANSITKAEFFVDTDPGFGKATNISNLSGETIDATVDLSSIASGLHNLYIRTQDAQANWSQTVSRPFIKSSLENTNSKIVEAEYFIDTVGSFGEGKAVSVSSQSNNVIIDVLADLKDIADGDHTFYVRAKDNNGQWSMIEKLNFQVVPNTALISLSENEKLILYPNPTTSNFRVKGFEGKLKLSIYNLNGKLLDSKEFTDTEAVSISTLPKGIYMVKIYTDEGKVEKMLIKN